MSFWTTSTGKKCTGSEEAACVGSMTVIPDGTSAPAVIKKIEIIIPEQGVEYYQVTWKLCEPSEFKNHEVRMKMEVNNVKKADRAKEMLLRLYLLSGVTPPQEAPTSNDIRALQGLVLGIHIAEWQSVNDKGEPINGNWVRAVFKADSDFKTESGTKPPAAPVNGAQARGLDSALTRNAARKSEPFVDDDLANFMGI
jgi:hypothetical protein